jgi:hypothetical protein
MDLPKLYDMYVCKPHKSPTQKHTATLPKPKQKWATFTYLSKETTYITNIFKHSDIKIAFRTNSSLLNNLTTHTHTHKDQHSSSGIYKLICPDCNKAYIGQTGETSPYDTSTNMPSTTVAPLLTLSNTLMNTFAHLAISTQSCVSYNIRKKTHT